MRLPYSFYRQKSASSEDARQLKKVRQWAWVGLSAIGTATAILGLQSAGVFQILELTLLDHWFRLRPVESIESRIVIVTISDSDFKSLGRYPISDETLATLLTKIKQQNPRVIGLDVYRNLPIEPGHDKLEQVYATTPNLIGIEKALSGENLPFVEPPPRLRDRKQVAASDLVLDPDGKVRRSLLSLRVKSIGGGGTRTIYTLGARLAIDYLKTEGIKSEVEANSQIRLGKARLSPLQPNVGGYQHADVGGYQLLSNFRNLRQGFTSISLSDVLQDRIPARLMQDRIVLIGSTAESLNDRFFTPYSVNPQTLVAGVELHADLASQLISAAIDGRSLLQGAPSWINVIWIISCVGVGAVLGVKIRSLQGAIVWTVCLGFGLLLIGYQLFLGGWWVVIATPMIGMSTSGLITRGYLVWKTLKRSHRSLQNHAKELEEKVQARTQALMQQNLALTQAKQEAEAANRAKNTFLANVNHELRTPLSIILSSSELLSYDNTLTAKQRDRLSTINQSVDHLLDLINAVLELARLEADAESLEVSVVSVPSLLQNLAEMFSSQAIAKQLDLVFEDKNLPRQIQTDERKLRQVLINLINNAIKFTDRGSITLRAIVQESDASEPSLQVLRFEVEDTGIGIAPQEMDSLFKAFMQTESGRKSRQGSGLGLSISYRLVRLLGGKLQVHSTVGQGSLFWFELPCVAVLSNPFSASEAIEDLMRDSAESLPTYQGDRVIG